MTLEQLTEDLNHLMECRETLIDIFDRNYSEELSNDYKVLLYQATHNAEKDLTNKILELTKDT